MVWISPVYSLKVSKNLLDQSRLFFWILRIAFSFTEVPVENKYQYTFNSLLITIEVFLNALSIDKFVVYIFDYGIHTFLSFHIPPKHIFSLLSAHTLCHGAALVILVACISRPSLRHLCRLDLHHPGLHHHASSHLASCITPHLLCCGSPPCVATAHHSFHQQLLHLGRPAIAGPFECRS